MTVRRYFRLPGMRLAGFAGLALSLSMLPGCSTEFDPDEARADQTIRINLNASDREFNGFSPNPVTVIARTRVTWTNMDTTMHQIRSTAGLFEGDPLAPNRSYSFIISQPGTYRYGCLVPGHSESGVINVTP
jgi:plastocyanin